MSRFWLSLSVCISASRADLAADLTTHLRNKLPFSDQLSHFTDMIPFKDGNVFLNRGRLYGMNSASVSDVQKLSDEEVQVNIKFYVNCVFSQVFYATDTHSKPLYPWFSTSSENSMTVILSVKDGGVEEAKVTTTELNGIDACSSCEDDAMYKDKDTDGTDVYSKVKEKVVEHVKDQLTFYIRRKLKNASVNKND